MDSIEQIKEKYTPVLMQLEGIEGVGVGENSDGKHVVIYISAISQDIKEKIHQLLKDCPHRFEKTGSFNAL